MACAHPPTLLAVPPTPGVGDRLFSFAVGLLCAGAIFGVLAWSQRSAPTEETPEVYTARQVTIPLDEPPPAAEAAPTELAPLASPIRLEIAASASPVRLQVPDMPLVPVVQAPPAARPTVLARFDLAKSAVRPRVETEEPDGRRVFERGEVDQQPLVLQRVKPRVSFNDASLLDTPRTTMLLVVNTDGTVGQVKVLQTSQDDYFDRIMIETIREWRFSPAVRKGRKVRCWVQQTISIQLNQGSPFSAN